jgi:APA family basic amino acid/polyamine antiporter
MANLLIRKPLSMLTAEAGEAGERSLKRTLGVFQLTALGVGAIIGAGIFVLSGLGAHYAGPGLMLSFVLSGLGCAFAGLCYAEFAAMIPLAGSAYTYAYATLGELFAWIIGWDLTLEYAMGASTVSSGWSNHFIELLDILHIKMPLWLAYDHWTGLAMAEKTIARQIALGDHSLAPGTQAFLTKVSDIVAAQSPDLLRRAHDLLAAPRLFGRPDRARDHRHPGHRHQGKRAVQRHHRGRQGIGGAVRDRTGRHVRASRQLGPRMEHVRAHGLFRSRRGSGLHLLRLHRIRRGLDHRAGG